MKGRAVYGPALQSPTLRTGPLMPVANHQRGGKRWEPSTRDMTIRVKSPATAALDPSRCAPSKGSSSRHCLHEGWRVQVGALIRAEPQGRVSERSRRSEISSYRLSQDNHVRGKRHEGDIRSFTRRNLRPLPALNDPAISFAIPRLENFSIAIRLGCLRMGSPNPNIRSPLVANRQGQHESVRVPTLRGHEFPQNYLEGA